jgi:hypothetical protein
MTDVLVRIDAWESAGLIDPATAERLRAVETGRASGSSTDEAGPAGGADRGRAPGFPAVFGPGVTVGEMFAYLGIGFLLGAWTAFAARLSGGSSNTSMVGVGFAVAAAALVVLGFVLRSGDARRRRAAGVAFVGATGYASAATAAFVGLGLDGDTVALIAGFVALLVAGILRRLHPALTTEFGLLAAVTGFGAGAMGWIERSISPSYDGFNGNQFAGFDPLGPALLQAGGWLLVALALGLYAIRVARPDDGDPAAGRRAALIRAWAGLVAVIGLATALTRSAYDGEDFRRVMPAWAADAAILAVAIVLVERAFRRDSGAFLFAAGVGFLAALTDFNFTYLTDSTEVGLLVEGVILLGVGFVADRLRRRLSAADPSARLEPPTDVRPPTDDRPPAGVDPSPEPTLR